MKIISFSPLFLMFIIISSCKPKQTTNLEEMARLQTHPEAVVVKTVEAERTTFYHELISNGKLASRITAVVPFKINGIIKELNIINGQRVHQGDLLAVIDDFDYQNQLERARQNYEKAEINFRDDILTSYSATDTINLSPAKIKTSRIRSGLNDALSNLAQAEYNFSNTRVKTPVSGVVANLEAKQWNPSQDFKNLCTIIDDRVMEAEFPVIESEYRIIEKGMPVGIVPFIDDSLMITGSVTQINPQVDNNGMVKVIASFRNPGQLIDGMNVRVVIKKPVPDRIVVPKEALVIRQGKDVIFVRQDTLAIWKYVTVEFENSKSVSISEGIEPGDLVIVSGNVNLAHETVVKEQ